MTTELKVEHADGKVFGRLLINDNLIIDEADAVAQLELNMKKLIYDFEGVTGEIQFQIIEQSAD